MGKQKILAVDANRLDLMGLSHMLEKEYEVSTMMDGSTCVSKAIEIKPDLILLDHELSDIDGATVCEQLKEEALTAEIPILFVSEKTTLKTRLKGYEAGAEDFIQRPYEDSELLIKIKLILGTKSRLQQLKDDSEQAFNATMTAATETGEIAAVVDFFRKSFSIRSLERLADGLLKVLLDYNLASTVFIHCGDEDLYLSSNTEVTEKDKMIIQEKADKEKIHSFGDSTIFNFRHFNLLIQKMSVDDPDKYGRDKDNIALLGEGVDARVIAITFEQAQIQQGIKRKHIIEKTNMALAGLNEQQEEQQREALEIVDWLGQEMEDSFMSLGLSSKQEDFLMDLVATVRQRSLMLFEKNADLSRQLEEVMEELNEDIELPELIEQPEEDDTDGLEDDGFMIL
jgi:CheY-like chemotaxis protein